MRLELRLGISAAVLAALACSGSVKEAATSNSGGTSSVCPAGSERCACYGNSTCNQGLECRSNLCVAGGSGGSTSTSGTSSTGAAGSTTVACLYNNQAYAPGASFPSTDGCNSCYCSSTGLVNCTATFCVTATGGANNAGGAGQNLGGTGQNLGGTTVAGGASSIGFDPNAYCNGLLQGKSCSQTTVQADLRAVNMLLVLDDSGSTNQPPSATDPSTKWSEMKQALAATLPSVGNDINFGLELFPFSGNPNVPIDGTSSDPNVSCAVPSDPSAIAVPIAAGLSNLNSILNIVNNSRPAGGTPTTKALQQAYSYFTQGAGKNLAGTKWVLLATDGGPNCNQALSCTKDTCTQNIDLMCGDHTANTTINCCDGAGYICLDDAAAVSQISNLAAAGIKTYVVGLPGSEAYASTLNNMAIAGQVPNSNGANGTLFYSVSASNSLVDLQTALSQITTQLVKKCDIQLASSPPNIARVNVAIDCVLQTMVSTGSPSDAAGVDGYYIDYTTSPAHIKLVGAPCASILNNGTGHVDLIAGCPRAN